MAGFARPAEEYSVQDILSIPNTVQVALRVTIVESVSQVRCEVATGVEIRPRRSPLSGPVYRTGGGLAVHTIQRTRRDVRAQRPAHTALSGQGTCAHTRDPARGRAHTHRESRVRAVPDHSVSVDECVQSTVYTDKRRMYMYVYMYMYTYM